MTTSCGLRGSSGVTGVAVLNEVAKAFEVARVGGVPCTVTLGTICADCEGHDSTIVRCN